MGYIFDWHRHDPHLIKNITKDSGPYWCRKSLFGIFRNSGVEIMVLGVVSLPDAAKNLPNVRVDWFSQNDWKVSVTSDIGVVSKLNPMVK
jgi:hypothetical protein